MKKNKILSIFILLILLFTSCSSDNDNPEPINEEELITTIIVTLNPDNGGTVITLESKDLDGDGPNAPVIEVSGNLVAGTSYTGDILLLNESETPPENITEEVEDEDDEHQFFYTIGDGLDITTEYVNFDGDGNPLGTQIRLNTGTASNGTLTFTLRHEPKKPNDGTLADAGGETDIAQTFNLTVE
ncbi:type 1 periplasmic binding fold superfamily protein [Maribacter flavus]|uniref:Type 1 periplasmic binding fold superfamily protein n=1 Tax=Maribacter flavus TaxID=1658664 RepID=A0A5B2TVW8_9FLAO|nr:type 1 periplasmic binding fold superfamily protein [Maribacter flavus]KAA2218667.1 type 1 periplasmic binding fold superfamily protein [Maribacter flavus]